MQESILSTKRNTKASFFGDWTPGSSTSLSKKSTPHTWEAVLLETQAKQKITQNKKLLIIGIFSIVSLAVILETFFTVSWILINETDQYEYWVSLLSVEKLCKDLPAGEAQLLCHQSNQVIYTFQTSDFFSSNCQADMLTTDDPENLCSILRIFRITGLIACFGVVIGMLLHLFCVLQYLRLTCKRGKVNINQPVLVRLLIVTIIFYVVSWIVWIVFSLLMAEDATNSSFFGRLGSSFYLYFFSVVVFIGLVWWFKKSMGPDVKMKLVTALLGTTKKYNIETKEAQIELQEIKIVGALEATEQ